MATQKIALLIHKGKEIAQKLNILGGQNGAGAQGNPVIVQAQAGAKYQLALENENGLAPENIGVKRMGDDLHIAFEGGDIDAPDLIIEDYYQDDDGAAGYADAAPHELIGMHENGAMYSFVPESALPAEAISVLGNGAEAAQVLGGALGAGPAALGINPAAFAPLLGLAGLGGGGGGGGGGGAPASVPAGDTTVVTPELRSVVDTSGIPSPIGGTSTNTDGDLVGVTNKPDLGNVQGYKLVNYKGDVLTVTSDFVSVGPNDYVRIAPASNELPLGQTVAMYAYDSSGNYSKMSNFTDGMSTSVSLVKYDYTIKAHDDSGHATIDLTGGTAANPIATDDNRLAFTVELKTTNMSVNLDDAMVYLYDNGNYVGQVAANQGNPTRVDTDGDGVDDMQVKTWTLNDTTDYDGLSYANGSEHHFTAVFANTNSDQKMTINTANELYVQKNENSALENNSELVGAKTRLNLSDVLDHDNDASTPDLEMVKVQGDAGDVLNIGLSNPNVGWVKIGEANYAGDAGNTYDIYRSGNTQIIVDSDIQLI